MKKIITKKVTKKNRQILAPKTRADFAEMTPLALIRYGDSLAVDVGPTNAVEAVRKWR